MGVDDIDGVDLMPLETPVLRVSRPVAACSRCRTAKIKCDGKLPACTSCERSGRAAECTSNDDQFARGKERSYVSTLETRLERLQTKLEEAHRRKPSVVSIPDDETATAVPSRRASYEPEMADQPPTPIATKAQRRREASAIDDLVSGFGFLSVNATARDFYGFTSAMSYARLILSACSKDPLPQGTTKALPSRQLAMQLVQHYLNNVFKLIPVFDEASFYASVDNVYHRDQDKADSVDHWMVRMVLAVANASMSERSGDQYHLEGIGHVCAALELAEEVLHPGAISSVQALVLLVEYAMLDPHHFDSWNLIGVASRAMIDLGLHHDPPKGAAMSKGKLELRRRVFWCVYALDRSTSLVQTRAFSFSDNSANVKIPFARHQPSSTPPDAQEASARAWLQSHQQALDLITLRQMQSTWYNDLFQSGRTTWDEPYPYIWKTCDDMRKWFDGVCKTASMNMKAFFELDLLYSYIYVLSPSPRVPVVSSFAQTLIFEYCIRYADLVLRLISSPEYTAPMTFYDAMRVYMTGRQFLDVLQQNTDGLLNGVSPPRPEVRPSAAPPPSLPQVMLPPGDTVQRFNTMRSITCIKQITDCLARFGTRWGYMSWNQRYQTETEAMLNDLMGRLRELEIMAGARRPSMWQHSGSTSSIGSNNSGSTQYASPHSSMQGQQLYQPQQTQGNLAPPVQGYGDNGQGRNYSDPNFQQQQPQAYLGFESMATFPTNFPPQAPQVQQPAQPAFNFNDPSSPFQNQPFQTNPHSQFGNWGGYSGPSVPDTLDEENAVAPFTPETNAFMDRLAQQSMEADIDMQRQQAQQQMGASGHAQSFGSQGGHQAVMHDPAGGMAWEHTHLAGGSETAGLPAQPLRSTSFGHPLQPIDSNAAQPQPTTQAHPQPGPANTGKGKAPQLNPGDPGYQPWHPTQPPQDPPPNPSAFHFAPSTSQNQPPPGLVPHPSLPQGFYHAEPRQTTEQAVGNRVYRAYLTSQQTPRRPPSPMPPLAHAYPGLGAPVAQDTSHAQPGVQPQVQQPPPSTVQHCPPQYPPQKQMPMPPPPPPPRVPPTTASGYRFQPQLGFVCQVCGTVVQRPGMHIATPPVNNNNSTALGGSDARGGGDGVQEWCSAYGPLVAEDQLWEVQRREAGNRGSRRRVMPFAWM